MSVTKCKQELGFMWKFDVVLGSYGPKNLRMRRKARGLKREIRVISRLKDLKPFFVEKGSNLNGPKI
jgi:hypothetical protein